MVYVVFIYLLRSGIWYTDSPTQFIFFCFEYYYPMLPIDRKACCTESSKDVFHAKEKKKTQHLQLKLLAKRRAHPIPNFSPVQPQSQLISPFARPLLTNPTSVHHHLYSGMGVVQVNQTSIACTCHFCGSSPLRLVQKGGERSHRPIAHAEYPHVRDSLLSIYDLGP